MRGSEALAFDKEAHKKTDGPPMQAYAIEFNPAEHRKLGTIQKVYTKWLLNLCVRIAEDAAWHMSLLEEETILEQITLEQQLENTGYLLQHYADMLEREIKVEFPILTDEQFRGFDILGHWQVAGIKRHHALISPFATRA